MKWLSIRWSGAHFVIACVWHSGFWNEKQIEELSHHPSLTTNHVDFGTFIPGSKRSDELDYCLLHNYLGSTFYPLGSRKLSVPHRKDGKATDLNDEYPVNFCNCIYRFVKDAENPHQEVPSASRHEVTLLEDMLDSLTTGELKAYNAYCNLATLEGVGTYCFSWKMSQPGADRFV